jgi:hypothetical protein
MENLYGYGFWYNHFESTWYAIPREKWTNFFSGMYGDKSELEGVLKSSNIDDLIQLINNPDIEKIKSSEDYGNALTSGFMGE